MANNLRIISGKYRSKTFEGDSIVGTRPTMNRVKESLFAMIQNDIKDSACLDLFAGSGNLGLEALSNGAQCCYFVDLNKIATDTITRNIKRIDVKEEYHVLTKDYQEALKSFRDQDIKFDIIFLDPPYHLHLTNDCLKKIKEYALLQDNGLIVCEYESEEVVSNDFTLYKERTYGSKKIVIYQK